MYYHVILIEYFRPTHHWVYNSVLDAMLQLERLNTSFEECREIYATLIKTGHCARDHLPDQLIQEMIVPPRSE